jgi:hypothetical protein
MKLNPCALVKSSTPRKEKKRKINKIKIKINQIKEGQTQQLRIPKGAMSSWLPLCIEPTITPIRY